MGFIDWMGSLLGPSQDGPHACLWYIYEDKECYDSGDGVGACADVTMTDFECIKAEDRSLEFFIEAERKLEELINR